MTFWPWDVSGHVQPELRRLETRVSQELSSRIQGACGCWHGEPSSRGHRSSVHYSERFASLLYALQAVGGSPSHILY